MLIAMDTYSGNQWKIGRIQRVSGRSWGITDGGNAMTFGGIERCRHILTPLPADHIEVKYRSLGKALYESVPEEYQEDITGEFRRPTEESHWDGSRVWDGGCSDHLPCVILSDPVAEPAPALHTISICGEDVQLTREAMGVIREALRLEIAKAYENENKKEQE